MRLLSFDLPILQSSHQATPMFNTASAPGSVAVHIVYEDQLESWLNGQADSARTWIRASGFKAEKNRVLLIPDAAGGLVAVACGAGTGKRASTVSNSPCSQGCKTALALLVTPLARSSPVWG